MPKVGVNTVLAVIGLVIGISLIPTMNTAIEDANLTGLSATVAGFIPVVFIVGALVAGYKAWQG